MSYDKVHESLTRCRQALDEGDTPAGRQALVDALEELTSVVEREFAQVKAALSHLATLMERQER